MTVYNMGDLRVYRAGSKHKHVGTADVYAAGDGDDGDVIALQRQCYAAAKTRTATTARVVAVTAVNRCNHNYDDCHGTFTADGKNA